MREEKAHVGVGSVSVELEHCQEIESIPSGEDFIGIKKHPFTPRQRKQRIKGWKALGDGGHEGLH